jgi:hypothetical protein
MVNKILALNGTRKNQRQPRILYQTFNTCFNLWSTSQTQINIIFFDKEFATQAILDWLEKKGKLQEHNY